MLSLQPQTGRKAQQKRIIVIKITKNHKVETTKSSLKILEQTHFNFVETLHAMFLNRLKFKKLGKSKLLRATENLLDRNESWKY